MIILGLMVVIFTFIKVKYNLIDYYHTTLVSDFKTMWEYAVEMYQSGRFIPPNRLQVERPLASLVPLVFFFGDSPVVYKLSNIVFIMLTSVMVTDLIRRTVSHEAALLLFIMLMFVPEIYFASLITSHDLTGSFYVVLYLYLTYMVCNRYMNEKLRLWRVICILPIIGFVGLLLDVQRNIYNPLVMAVMITVLLLWQFQKESIPSKKIIVIAAIIIVPFLFENIAESTLRAKSILVNWKDSSLFIKHVNKIRFMHTYSNGTGANSLRLWNDYAKGFDKEEDIVDFAKSLILSDFYYNYAERPQNYLMRSERLFRLGTQWTFHTKQVEGLSGYRKKKFNAFNKFWNTTFVTLYLLLLLISTAYFAFSKHNKSKSFIYFSAIFMSIITIALLLISENQPRYLFIGWFFWSTIIVWFIDEIFTKKTLREDSSVGSLFTWRGMAVFTLLVVFVFVLARSALGTTDLLFIDMSKWNDLQCAESITEKECLESLLTFDETLDDKKYSTLVMMLPRPPHSNDFVRNEKRIEANDNKKYTLGMYVMSPYFRKDGISGYFDVNIYVNGELRETMNIADSEKFRYVRVSNIIPINGAVTVSLEIKSNADYKAISWQNASKTIFKFCSLREQ